MTISLMTKLAAIVSVSFVAVFATGCANEDFDDDTAEDEAGDEEFGETESALRSGSQACGNGWGCIYAGNNYSGRKLQFQDGGCQNLKGFDNQASSLWNNSRRRMAIYSGANCTGKSRTFLFGAAVSTLGTLNNQVSSIRLY